MVVFGGSCHKVRLAMCRMEKTGSGCAPTSLTTRYKAAKRPELLVAKQVLGSKLPCSQHDRLQRRAQHLGGHVGDGML